MQSMAMRITGAGQRCRGCENIRSAATLFVGLGLQDLAATIEAVGADVVAQMGFAGGGLDRGGRIDQKIVRAVHATLGRGLLVLLNSHEDRKSTRLNSSH